MKRVILFLYILAITPILIAQDRKLVFATYTYAGNNRLQNLEPLVLHLSEKSGLLIEAKSYASVSGLIAAIKNDSVDFAMMNTFGYLVLQRNHPGITAALANLDMGDTQSTRYGSCLIASKLSGIRSLADILNHDKRVSLALVNSSSTSGNLMPRLMLNSWRIASAEAKFRVYYAGTHKKVVDDVLSGKAEVGGCGCSEIDSVGKSPEFDEKAVVVSSYDNIPLGPVVYKKSLHDKSVRVILELLLRVHDERPDLFVNFCNGWTEFRQAKRFKKISDKEFDNFRLLFGDNEELWKLIQ